MLTIMHIHKFNVGLTNLNHCFHIFTLCKFHVNLTELSLSLKVIHGHLAINKINCVW